MLYVDYKDVIGELYGEYEDYEGNVHQVKETLCGGNSLCASVLFFKENDKEMVQLKWFFNDKDHMKRCMGIMKGYDSDNMFAPIGGVPSHGWLTYKRLVLDANHRATKTLLDGFTKIMKDMGDFKIEVVNGIKEEE